MHPQVIRFPRGGSPWVTQSGDWKRTAGWPSILSPHRDSERFDTVQLETRLVGSLLV